MMRGVTSTEYTILLAVVLVIVLAVAGALLDVPGIASDTKYAQSNSYWKNDADPVALLEHTEAPGVFTGVLQNTGTGRIKVTEIRLDGERLAISGDGVLLAPGSRKALSLTDASICPPGSTYYEHSVVFGYQDAQGTPHTQTGGVPIYGQCLAEVPEGCLRCGGGVTCCTPNVCGEDENGFFCTTCGNGICDELCDACPAATNDCCVEACQSCNTLTGTCDTLPAQGQECDADGNCCEGLDCYEGETCTAEIDICLLLGESCSISNPISCCTGRCESKSEGEPALCCKAAGNSCGGNNDCCGSLICNSNSPIRRCAACPSAPGGDCANDNDCCSETTGFSCNRDTNKCQICTVQGAACDLPAQCCGYPGMTCLDVDDLGQKCAPPFLPPAGGDCGLEGNSCNVGHPCCPGQGMICNVISHLCEGGTPDLEVSLLGTVSCFSGDPIIMTITATNIGTGIFNRDGFHYPVRLLRIDAEGTEMSMRELSPFDVIRPGESLSWDVETTCPSVSGATEEVALVAYVNYADGASVVPEPNTGNNRAPWNIISNCKGQGISCEDGNSANCCAEQGLICAWSLVDESFLCMDMASACGNEICDSGESCANCAQDCNPISCGGDICCDGYWCDLSEGSPACTLCLTEEGASCPTGNECCSYFFCNSNQQCSAAYSEISAGGYHTCGIREDGKVLCWGLNGAGQIGDGTTVHKLTPTLIAGDYTYTAISTGSYHTCGIREDGKVLCWGDNHAGQIGDGTSGTNRLVPTLIAGDDTYTAISAGYQHTCGMRASDGKVLCWGLNDAGALGDGTRVDHLTPTLIAGDDTYTAISAGALHTCGIREDGKVLCWGYNNYGELGDGNRFARLTPTLIAGDDTYTAIRAGSEHVCGIREDGKVLCWGYNSNGQIGDDTSGTDRLVPTPIAGDDTYTAISAGGHHTCAIREDDKALCWGQNDYSQLGDGTTTDRYVPTLVITGQ
jgi:hypothetical protein